MEGNVYFVTIKTFLEDFFFVLLNFFLGFKELTTFFGLLGFRERERERNRDRETETGRQRNTHR